MAKSNFSFVNWLWSWMKWPEFLGGKKTFNSDHKKNDDSPNVDTSLEEFKAIDMSPDVGISPGIDRSSNRSKLSDGFSRFANYSEWAPYSACKKAWNVISPIVGPNKLAAILVGEFILTMGLNLLHIKIASEIAGNKAEFDKFLSGYNSDDNNNVNNQLSHITSMAMVMGLSQVSSVGISLVNETVVRGSELLIKFCGLDKQLKQHYDTLNKENQPLFLSMSAMPKASSLIPTAPQNLGTVTRLSNKIFVSAVTACVNGAVAGYELLKITRISDGIYNPLVMKLGFSAISGGISGIFSSISSNKRKEAVPNLTETREIETEKNNNPLQIALLGGGESSRKQIQGAADKMRPLEIKITVLDVIIKSLKDLVGKLDEPLNYFITASQVIKKNITPDSYPVISMHLKNVSAIFNWSSVNNDDVTAMRQPLDNLVELNRIKEQCLDHKPTFNRTFNGGDPKIDIIGLRIYKHSPKEPYTPVFIQDPENNRDFKEIFNSSNAITINLENELGAKTRTLLHSPSGLGKSTLLNALNNICLPGAPVSGTFCFPKGYDEKDGRPNIFMLPQMARMPVHTSFLEVLCYPESITTSENKPKAESIFSFKGFFESIGLINTPDNSNVLSKEREESVLRIASYVVKEFGMAEKFNDFIKEPHLKKRNWNDKSLSGGEQKVIPIIWTILQNPKILFLDEADTGLDDKRIESLYKVLNECLPDTAIVAISHTKPEEIDVDNHSFYNQKCNLEEYNTPQNKEEIRPESPQKTPMRRNSSTVNKMVGDLGVSGDHDYSHVLKETLRRARGNNSQPELSF